MGTNRYRLAGSYEQKRKQTPGRRESGGVGDGDTVAEHLQKDLNAAYNEIEDLRFEYEDYRKHAEEHVSDLSNTVSLLGRKVDAAAKILAEWGRMDSRETSEAARDALAELQRTTTPFYEKMCARVRAMADEFVVRKVMTETLRELNEEFMEEFMEDGETQGADEGEED